MKKQIKIAFADMWRDFDPEWFGVTQILKRKYDIVIDYKNPDFVICGCDGNDYLKYDCPRILYLGEAITPDFNVYDYAIGFDHIQFGNRYLRCPLYIFYTNDWHLAKKKHLINEENLKSKNKFCNFVVSNGEAMPIREEFFHRLSEKRRVDSGGRYLNNMPDKEVVPNKLEFQREYKFSLAFENSVMDGYVTEKIVQAWAAGTIPIYYGGNNVEFDFNEKAFIDVSKFETLEECISYILYVDNNIEEYMKIMREPILKIGQEIDYEGKLLEFFDYIISHPEHRRNSKLTLAGKYYELRKGQGNSNKILFTIIWERIKRKLGIK